MGRRGRTLATFSRKLIFPNFPNSFQNQKPYLLQSVYPIPYTLYPKPTLYPIPFEKRSGKIGKNSSSEKSCQVPRGRPSKSEPVGQESPELELLDVPTCITRLPNGLAGQPGPETPRVERLTHCFFTELELDLNFHQIGPQAN
jgi:hypothetical protein